MQLCAHIADYYFNSQKHLYDAKIYEEWSNEYDKWLNYLSASMSY